MPRLSRWTASRRRARRSSNVCSTFPPEARLSGVARTLDRPGACHRNLARRFSRTCQQRCPHPDRCAPTVGPADSVVSPAAPVAPEKSAANAAADDATSTVSPKPPSATIRPEMPPVVSRDQRAPAVSQTGLPQRPISPQSRRLRPGSSVKPLHPIDYSPLVTAQIQPLWSEKAAPDSLLIRCRQSRVELLLRMRRTRRALHPVATFKSAIGSTTSPLSHNSGLRQPTERSLATRTTRLHC